MRGGIMQLVARGAQDFYLTGNSINTSINTMSYFDINWKARWTKNMKQIHPILMEYVKGRFTIKCNMKKIMAELELLPPIRNISTNIIHMQKLGLINNINNTDNIYKGFEGGIKYREVMLEFTNLQNHK